MLPRAHYVFLLYLLVVTIPVRLAVDWRLNDTGLTNNTSHATIEWFFIIPFFILEVYLLYKVNSFVIVHAHQHHEDVGLFKVLFNRYDKVNGVAF